MKKNCEIQLKDKDDQIGHKNRIHLPARFTGATPRTLGYRKFEKGLSYSPSDWSSSSCPEEARGIQVQVVKGSSVWGGDLDEDVRARAGWRASWKEPDYPGTSCVINKAMFINAGDTSKDIEARVKGHTLLKSNWCWSLGPFPSPAGVCQCWVNGRLSLDWQWKSMARGFFPTLSFKSPAQGCLLHCYCDFIVTALPPLPAGHNPQALTPVSLPFACPYHAR